MPQALRALTGNSIAIILVALIGGGGSHYAIMKIDPPRPDPFTGNQGKDLERRIGNLEEILRKEYNLTNK